MTMVGWGSGGYGSSGWGGLPPAGPGGIGIPLQVVAASAVAENVVRVQFTTPVYYSGVLDPGDASNAALWQVLPVTGTSGLDGQPARPVSVLSTALPTIAGAAPGLYVDVTLDRPMTPYPAQYTAVVGTISSADQSQTLDPSASMAATPSVYMALARTNVESSAPMRDFANPQSPQAARNSTIAQPAQTALGSFGYTDDHDYAIDSRDDGLRKRLNRRLFSRKGGYLHLGDGYGVGITTYIKRLGKAAVREQLTADVETQFAQEPEVAKVTALTRPDTNNPGLFRLDVFVQKRNGQTTKYKTLFPVQ